jgi:radical SAM protein with 4Fe4S-binding SPASM domain
MITWIMDWIVGMMLWGSERLYTLSRSRTGYDNPRTKHITGLTYLAHIYWMLFPNIIAWLNGNKALFPAVVMVQTVNRCNGRCSVCPYSYTIHLQEKGVMEDALFHKIIHECAKEKNLHRFVPMAKNEPLLDKKLEERIAEFRKVAAPHQIIELVTNGSALTPTRFASLVASGVDLISISLNAATEEVFNQVKHGISWKQVKRNIDAITQADLSKVNIFLRYVRQHENASGLRQFSSYWKRSGFNIYSFEINNRGGTVKNYDKLRPHRNILQHQFRVAMSRRLFNLCPFAFSIANIMQNGDVPLCAMDWNNLEILGNVNQNTIREIFNSPRMQEIRTLMHQMRYDEIVLCRNCSFKLDLMADADNSSTYSSQASI